MDFGGKRQSRMCAIGCTAVVALAVLARTQVVTKAAPYGAGHLGLTGIAKAVVRIGEMLVKPAVPLDPGIVLGRSHPAMAALDWGILVVLAGVAGFASGVCAPSLKVARL